MCNKTWNKIIKDNKNKNDFQNDFEKFIKKYKFKLNQITFNDHTWEIIIRR